MAHGDARHVPADLDLAFAGIVAETMQALGAPSRVRILGRLHAGVTSIVSGFLAHVVACAATLHTHGRHIHDARDAAIVPLSTA